MYTGHYQGLGHKRPLEHAHTLSGSVNDTSCVSGLVQWNALPNHQNGFMARGASITSVDSSMVDTSDNTIQSASHSPRTFIPSDQSIEFHTSMSLSLSPSHVHGAHYVDTNHVTALQLDPQNIPFTPSQSFGEANHYMASLDQPRRRDYQSFDASTLSSHPQRKEHMQMPKGRHHSLASVSYDAEHSISAPNLVANMRSNSLTSALDPFTPYQRYKRGSISLMANVPSTSGSHVSSDRANHSVVHHAVTATGPRRQYYADGAEHTTRSSSVSSSDLHFLTSPNVSREPSFQPNSAFRQHNHGATAAGFSSHRSSISSGFPFTSPDKQEDTARACPTPLFTRSARSSNSSAWADLPSTPTASIGYNAVYSENELTPTSVLSAALSSPGYDACYSAPSMPGQRSFSTASMDSPADGKVGSVAMDSRSRSHSTSAMGNTSRTRPRNLDPPLIVSSADKQYGCFCGKRFNRFEHLKRHSQIHTQKRPHQCPVESCGKFFGRSDNLAQHLKTHSRLQDQDVRHSETVPLVNAVAKNATTPKYDRAQAYAEGRTSPSLVRLGCPIALDESNFAFTQYQ